MTNILEATSFGATSTTDDVLSGVNLKGKRILVTGVSAGLGVETARSLAAHGAQVVGAARDLNKAKAATEQVRKDAAAHGGSFELVELDLANLKSVRACADGLLAQGETFDVVIANAGVMATLHSLRGRVREIRRRNDEEVCSSVPSMRGYVR
jgi:NAD(P)-dependent dehydrogenase (short-subunit alcohol dehydrogenase family)